MLVLVVNAGSSSLKAQLIQTDGKASLMTCLAEKVGTPQAFMKKSPCRWRASPFRDACVSCCT